MFMERRSRNAVRRRGGINSQFYFEAKLGNKCFCWCPFAMLVPVWMGICMASLGEGLCIFTSFNLLDSGIYPLNSFDFYWIYFEWRDTENQRLSPAQQRFSYLSRNAPPHRVA